jgi:two-component system, chemotaxis family, protein-glutamate methylesterase/glutaminase
MPLDLVNLLHGRRRYCDPDYEHTGAVCPSLERPLAWNISTGEHMAGRDIVVVGGSAGSIEAVSEVVRGLPPDFPAAVFVVVHFPGSVSSTLPRILSRAGPLPARHAKDGEPIGPRRIYVAPPDCHLYLSDGHVRLSRGPKENGHRPAIDPLFRTAAHSYGPRVMGVVLSGNLNDGTAGLLSIKQRDGIAIVQSLETALYSGMPRSAIDHVAVDHVLAPSEIPLVLSELALEPVPHLKVVPMSQDLPAEQQADEFALADRHKQPGVPSTMTCPECHGTLWEVKDEELVRFRCRVGHAYSDEALLVHQSEQLEAALWTALRSLEEHSALARRLAARANSRGHAHSASSFTEQAVDAEHHASVIRRVLDRGVRTDEAAEALVVG